MYLHLVFIHSSLISQALAPRIRICKQLNHKLSLVVRDTLQGVCCTLAGLTQACLSIWQQVESQVSHHHKNNVIPSQIGKGLPGINLEYAAGISGKEKLVLTETITDLWGSSSELVTEPGSATPLITANPFISALVP